MRFCLLFCAMVVFAQDPVCELRTIAGPENGGDGASGTLNPFAIGIDRNGDVFFSGLTSDEAGHLIFSQQQHVSILRNPQACRGTEDLNP